LNQPGSAVPNASRKMRAARGRFLPSSESPTPSTPLPSRPARPAAEAATGRRSLRSQPCPRPGSPPVERGKITAADAVVPASSARRNCALAGAILGSSSGLIVIRQLRPDGGQSWPPRAVSRAKRLAPPCGGELPVGQVHAGCRGEAGAGFSLRQAEQRRAVVAEGGGSRGRGRAGGRRASGRCRAAGRSAPASCHRESASAGSAAHEGAAHPSAWRRPCIPSMPLAGARQGPQDAQ
jgi:hypothetical protein